MASSGLSRPLLYRIGVDVGGTNTDAVLLSVSEESAQSPNRGVKATYKHPTTSDVNEGIEAGIRAVLKQADIDAGQVGGVMIGTTHFINAVLSSDRSRLSRVAVLRLGFPYTLECPPFIDFPPNLRSIVQGYWAVISGGHQIDGTAIGTVDEEEVRKECRKINGMGLSVIVLVGVYSPLDKESSQEEYVRNIIMDELGPSTDVVCSRDVGQIGFLERENASILNAAILRFARSTVLSFQRAILALGLACPLYLTQNDGTLTSAAAASRLPIKTFASGATNSMRGASYLAGLRIGETPSTGSRSTLVVDIGGTSTDVGVLLPSGFPRQAAAFIEVGGVRTNFSMPDVQSIALGGGSIVRFKHSTQNPDNTTVTVGPDSVGYNLLRDALVFGGQTPTTTDIVVAARSTTEQIGDTANAIDRFTAAGLEGAQHAIRKMLEGIIDKMKTSPEPVNVLLVGGGSIISPQKLHGVEELIRPPFFSCANAVGAAVASVSGQVDTIKILENCTLEEALKPLMEEAKCKAIKAGAKPETVKIVEVENLPIQYVTNKATRIIVRAVGDLDALASLEQIQPSALSNANTIMVTPVTSDTFPTATENGSFSLSFLGKAEIDISTYCPTITNREWHLSEIDLEWIQEGCGILGAGGGGSPYPPYLMAREIIRSGGVIRVVDSAVLPDDAVILRGHFMGSPSVSNERLQSGREIETAAHNLSKFVGLINPAAIISDEIGGGNGIQPMILASGKHLDLPVFDGDLMGRAYPNMYQSLPAAFDIPNSLTPCAIADGVNNTIVLPSTSDKYQVEAILRSVCTILGSKAGVSMAPLTAKICREFGVINTVSQAWRMGRAIALCRKSNDIKGIPQAILELQTGDCIFIGKIIEVNREVRAGFTWGSVCITSLHEDEKEFPNHRSRDGWNQLHITFQNEFLIAILEHESGIKKPMAVVPDLITVLDTQSGSSLGTHELRYGLRVTCLVLAGDPKWTTPQGLACGGPAAFGLNNVNWFSIGAYKKPRSVIEEFGT